MHINQSRSSGNVLFLILIAVALFAALSYAVTSSSRSGGPDAQSEKNQLSAASFVNFATSMKAGVDRLRYSGGCSEDTISFDNPIVTPNYVNPSAPQRCFLFHPLGGGLSWPSDSLVNNRPKSLAISASSQINDIGTNCTGSPYTPCIELLMLLLDITKEECVKINESLGIYQAGQDTPEIPDITVGSGFTGSYSNSSRRIGIISTDSSLSGKMSGCFRETMTQSYPSDMSTSQTPYIFYQVLLAR